MQASTHHDADDNERCDLCGGLVSRPAPVPEAGEGVDWSAQMDAAWQENNPDPTPAPTDRVAELEAALDTCSAALQRLHTDIDALMADSEGVAGLHRNGEVAPWSDLQEGGQYADWLGEPLWAARNAWSDARRALLSAQPRAKGEG